MILGFERCGSILLGVFADHAPLGHRERPVHGPVEPPSTASQAFGLASVERFVYPGSDSTPGGILWLDTPR